MFLHLLNLQEKQDFLELAYLVAYCDNEFHCKEQEIIKAFRHEMSLHETEYQVQNKQLMDILKTFKASKAEIQRAVFLEIVAVVKADQRFAKEEKELIPIIMKALNISEEQFRRMYELIEELQGIYQKAGDFVFDK